MINQELIDYIKEQISAGISKEDIKQALLDVGWSPKDIEDAFNELNKKTEEVKKEFSEEESPILPPQNIVDLKEGIKTQQQPKFISPESFIPKTSSNVFVTKTVENSTTQTISDKNLINLKSTDKTPQPQQIKIVSAPPHYKKFKIIIYILFGLLFSGLLGLAIFLYLQNSNLEEKLIISNSQQGDLKGEIQGLTKIINDFQKEISNLKESNNNLLNDKNDLLNQLLLFNSATSSLEIQLSVTPIKENNQYLLKTSQDILVNIKNTTELVKKILDNFLNQKIVVSGLRTPNRREITITKINDKLLEEWQNDIMDQSKSTTTLPTKPQTILQSTSTIISTSTSQSTSTLE